MNQLGDMETEMDMESKSPGQGNAFRKSFRVSS